MVEWAGAGCELVDLQGAAVPGGGRGPGERGSLVVRRADLEASLPG